LGFVINFNQILIVLAIAMTTRRKAFHEAIAKLKEKYGDMFSFRIGPCYIFVLSRVDHIQHVLADRQTYDISETTTRNFGLLFPGGLVALRGDIWKRHARIMLPMFRRNKISAYFDTIVTCIDRFIDEQFGQHNGKIHTNLVVRCQQVLLTIIARIAFNYDFETLSSSDGTNLRQAFNTMIHCANQFALMAGIPWWVAKLMLALNWKFQCALRTMKHYVMHIIHEEQMRQKQEIDLVYKPKTLIGSLVAAVESDSSSSAKASLSPNEVFDEVSMSILAGFETTSTALSWFIFFISKHPDVQQKIKDELHEHHLTFDAPLTQDALDALIYVECVTKELLRFAPIAAGTVRQATRDDIIDGIQVKKGDIFLIAIQNVHRDPRYWKIDPSKFVPERFLDEDKYPSQYAYMPFGGGHRACIGQDLAFLELKTAITRLLQRVTIVDAGNEGNNSGGFIQRVTCFPKHMAVRVFMDSAF
jgi:cytochrome P450